MFSGLTTAQAQQKLEEYGSNELQDIHKTSVLDILFRQVRSNFVLYLLTVTAVMSFFLGEALTTYVIIGVILIVVATGFIQEYKAEQAISALKKMIMPITRVIRDGKETEIPSSEIVPDDIIVLRVGEKIPADCLVVEQSNLRVNESVLTGESADIKKLVVAGGTYTEENLIFMGSFVVAGRCIAKVLQTGMSTRFGKIAGMISAAEKRLPLHDKINRISMYMVIIGLAAAILTGIVLFLRADALTAEVIIGIAIIVIALCVSSFPEGFPVVLTATLAHGVNRMAKQNAVINRMSIIETLGETSVICTDKTGTLTKGEMTIKKMFLDGELYDVSGVGYEAEGVITKDNKAVDLSSHHAFTGLLKCAVLCNDSNIERLGTDSEYKVIGSSTEGSLLILGAKLQVFKENFNGKRIEEMPFDSQRKMMSILYSEGRNKLVLVKGAPEVVLKKCTHILTARGTEKLSAEDHKAIITTNHQLTTSSFRSLALAYKHSRDDVYTEDELVFLGLVGMEDPPREEVAEAIAQCLQSGIKVKMITGDHRETALAIASEIGIKGEVLTGEEMDKLSDSELIQRVNSIGIFARVKPEDKLRIVQALKANGEIVTMTGDGVNDAPALKEAHIGVAMGINGTDVSRSVADMTLKDDNFATIVLAIKEGRTIFNNIRKFVVYELSCSTSDIFILFSGMVVAPFLGWYTPIITALQILFMNIVTDNIPAMTLGFNPTSKDIMHEHPRKNAQILTAGFFWLMILNGILMGLICFALAYLSFNILDMTDETARTTVFVGMILIQLANAFNFRSFRYLVLTRSLFINKYLFMASLFSIIATIVILYTPLNTVFDTVPLGLTSWVLAIAAGLSIIVLVDIQKMLYNK